MIKRAVLSGAALLMSWSVSAVTHQYTFNPSPVDVYDFQHQSLYTWGIGWSLPKGEHIAGATLSFKNINNWDAKQNILHFDLLNSAVPTITWHSNATVQVAKTNITIKKYYNTTGSLAKTVTTRSDGTFVIQTINYTQPVSAGSSASYETAVIDPATDHGVLKVYQDNTGDQEWQDEFVDPTRPLELNKATANSVTLPIVKESFNVAKTGRDDAKAGTMETTTYTEVRTKVLTKTTYNAYSWDAIELGDYVDANGTTKKDNFTYVFTKQELDTLASDLIQGGNFGIGFDPDCHFYNDGVTLVITTVPDGGLTAMLLGVAFVGLEGFRRRNRARC